MIRDKLYRDAVHNLIALDKNSVEDNTLMELIDSSEMQRLRRIRQTGLANLAYQGAEHSRFTHSIGVMYVATRVLEQLGRDVVVPPKMRFATRCAALLHDVGHGPLSHVFESFMGMNHETWTRRIILDRASEVNGILRRYHASLPTEVANIIDGKSKPRFLSQIIASQLDADRFDYLLRDSRMTGVKYGIYDFERLLRVLRLDERNNNIVVAANGVQAVEKYLQARYHMYSQVYLHKTVRAGERVFESLLRRAADIAHSREGGRGKVGAKNSNSDDPVASLLRLQPDDPLLILLKDKSHAELATYIQLDDDLVYAALRRWRDSDDAILSDLATRITQRKLFKTLNISGVKNMRAREKEAREVIQSAGFDPQYYFIIDSSGDVPYKPYDPRHPSSSSHILVEDGVPGSTKTRDIYEMSQVVTGLAKAAFTVKRVVFPGEGDLRNRMARIFFDADLSSGFLPGG